MSTTDLVKDIDECMCKFRSERLKRQFDTGDFVPDRFPEHLTRYAEAAAIVVITRQSDPAVVALVEALEAAREYLDGRIDVVDGDYGEPRPNQAMTLASMIDEALAAMPSPPPALRLSGVRSMTSHADKAQALAVKITGKAEDALAGLEREMAIMKWPAEFCAIMWSAVAETAARRAELARHAPSDSNET